MIVMIVMMVMMIVMMITKIVMMMISPCLWVVHVCEEASKIEVFKANLGEILARDF